ncbi:MAG: hypothetical protein CME71_05985 [Halobacteriovorax sp.]|nr:hypothetical protein [Halobacteriovorax sp.]
MSSLVKKFVTSCTLTFKAFEHEVIISKNQSNMWNFMAVNKRKDKVYAVYCAPRLASAKALVKVAMKKVPPDARLVVVTSEFTIEEKMQAEQDGYTLVTLSLLSKYGTEMLDLRQRDGEEVSNLLSA